MKSEEQAAQARVRACVSASADTLGVLRLISHLLAWGLLALLGSLILPASVALIFGRTVKVGSDLAGLLFVGGFLTLGGLVWWGMILLVLPITLADGIWQRRQARRILEAIPREQVTRFLVPMQNHRCRETRVAAHRLMRDLGIAASELAPCPGPVGGRGEIAPEYETKAQQSESPLEF